MTLPPSLRSQFDNDGHFSPIKIFSPEEAAQVYQDYRQYFARQSGLLQAEQCGPLSLVELLLYWALIGPDPPQ